MKKLILSLVAFGCATFMANAQTIPNASFENETGGAIDDWTLIAGKWGSITTYTVSTTQGNYTVNPSTGSRFGYIANDTTGAQPGSIFVGNMQTRFAFNRRPAKFMTDFLYLTGINTETFTINVMMFRDNAGTNDTILNRTLFLNQPGSLIPAPQGNVLPFLTLTSVLNPADYKGTNMPDSCVITVNVSGAWTQGNENKTSLITTLLVDNMRFSPEATSVEGISLANQKAISNYPNPASNSTTIAYELPLNSNVALSVFDINGRLVHSQNFGEQESGSHNIVFNTSSLQNGIYFYNVTTNYGVQSSKMVIVH